METNELVNTAIENLFKNTGIKAKWKAFTKNETDGKLTIQLKPDNIDFNIEVKREIRNHHIPALLNKADTFPPFMLIAEYIFPMLKKELINNNIAYLETTGNIYLKNNNHLIWVDTNKKIEKPKEATNRAFTKTGLKAVFLFLINEEYLNLPYRALVEITGMGLGNVNYIINGLKEQGFIIMINNKKMKLINKKELFEKWIGAYDTRLKPALHIGNFTFLNKKNFTNWDKIKFKTTGTLWGGEPAANLLTDYLNPEILTIYTDEIKQKLIPQYGLIPAPDGNIQIYKKFWKVNETERKTVPPILAYADLVNTGNKRCIETANILYKKYLNEKFEKR